MDVPEIDCTTAATMLADGAAWIDVREPFEWDEAHIADTTLVPLQQSLDYLTANLPDPTTPLVVSCRSGARSGQLVAYLRHELGYTDAHNLRGGIIAWVAEGRPIVTGGD